MSLGNTSSEEIHNQILYSLKNNIFITDSLQKQLYIRNEIKLIFSILKKLIKNEVDFYNVTIYSDWDESDLFERYYRSKDSNEKISIIQVLYNREETGFLYEILKKELYFLQITYS